MKKNSIFCSIVTFCLMLFAMAGFAQINTNGGFESWAGTSPDGWYGNKSNIGTANVVKMTTGAHTGNNACQLINTSSSHKRFTTQTVHVDNGIQYAISFWVKGTGDIRVAMFDDRATGSGYSSYSAWFSVNGTTYQQFVDTLQAANTTNVAEFILSVRNTDDDGDNLIVDDVVITAVTSAGFVAEPTVTLSGNMFSANTYFGSATATITAETGASIYYTLDGTEPTENSTLYSNPISITTTSTLKAIATLNGNSSSVVTRLHPDEGPRTGKDALALRKRTERQICDAGSHRGSAGY